MEMFNEIWVWVVSLLGGISLSSIITAILYGCLKGAFNKTISKINVQKIADQATEKGVEKVKKISFTHSIQPLVESELKKVNEHSVEVLKKELLDVKEKYDKVINILDKFAAYFDNSIGVPEEKKAELKQALLDAVETPIKAESVVVEETLEETTIKAVEPKQEPKTIIKVER